eukprot:s19_g26.t1
MDDVTYTFTGSMSVARLEDWVEYVEGNLLREYLVSYFPDYELTRSAAVTAHSNLLDSISSTLWDVVLEPPDRALDAVLGSLDMLRSFQPSFTFASAPLAPKRSDVQFVLVNFQPPLASDCLALVAAAKDNNLQDLEAGHQVLLQRPLNPNVMDANGEVPLGGAACFGNPEAALLLLEASADVETPMSDGATPLVIASQNGYVDFVQLLLEARADLNRAVPQQGASALHIACQNGHLEVARLLLDVGAEVNKTMNDGTAALFLASQQGYLEIVQLLLQQAADANMVNASMGSSLVVACEDGHLDVARTLLEARADQSATDDGTTPLFVAAQNGHLAVASLMLEFGANIELPIDDGATPLLVAS